MADPTTRRAEEIREASGIPWELACLQAEHERDATTEDRSMPITYLVIESTPGYMPESEPVDFEDYSEAVAYANELADELEEQGYSCDRSWASKDNYYAIKCSRSDTVAPDLGRYIAVERMED